MPAVDYRREIEELHQFFVDWYTGKLAQTEDDFARFSQVMAGGFYIVSPDGSLAERESLVTGLYAAYNKQTDFQIWIENVQFRQQYGDVHMVTYEEWQAKDGKETARLSTVVFCERTGLPNGLEWLFVHETWLPK